MRGKRWQSWIPLGLIELSSVARGFVVQDAAVKAANVELLMARTICSGKYIVAFAGDVASVNAALQAGAAAGTGAVIEKRVITGVHPSIFPAITGTVYLERIRPGLWG